MAFGARTRAGMHRGPDAWLGAYEPGGCRAATAAEIPVGHARRSLGVRADRAPYCPTCLRRVPPERMTRRLHREACASGPIDAWLLVCAACGCTLAAQVAPAAEEE